MNVTRADRHRLEAIVLDRSAPQKHVWRANIILATADGCGTAEINAAAQARLGEIMQAHLAGGGIILAATHGALGLDAARELQLDHVSSTKRETEDVA